jgi:hypothetical protein
MLSVFALIATIFVATLNASLARGVVAKPTINTVGGAH